MDHCYNPTVDFATGESCSFPLSNCESWQLKKKQHNYDHPLIRAGRYDQNLISWYVTSYPNNNTYPDIVHFNSLNK